MWPIDATNFEKHGFWLLKFFEKLWIEFLGFSIWSSYIWSTKFPILLMFIHPLFVKLHRHRGKKKDISLLYINRWWEENLIKKNNDMYSSYAWKSIPLSEIYLTYCRKLGVECRKLMPDYFIDWRVNINYQKVCLVRRIHKLSVKLCLWDCSGKIFDC